jgi:hypothetical protein
MELGGNDYNERIVNQVTILSDGVNQWPVVQQLVHNECLGKSPVLKVVKKIILGV